jgi:hypothetical protein
MRLLIDAQLPAFLENCAAPLCRQFIMGGLMNAIGAIEFNTILSGEK